MYRVAEIGGGALGLLAMLNPKMDTTAFCNILEKNRNDAVKIAGFLKERMKEHKEVTPVNGYTDYKEMIEKENPDIVMISTPNRLHADMSVFALAHGCHVLVEKPMCVSIEECERMVSAVKRTGLRLGVEQSARTVQGFQSIIDRIRAGEIGSPYYIRAEYLHGSLRPRLENPNDMSAQDPVLLGGGSHPIDLILGMMGEQAETVFASGSKFMSSGIFKYNDMMNVLMKFSGGRTGYCVTTHSCHKRGNIIAFELYGSDMDIIQTFTYDQAADTAGLRFFPAGQDAYNVCKFSDTQMEINVGHGQGFYRQIENLLCAIEHDFKQPTMADVVDGARTISTARAAEQSLLSGKAENVRQWEPLTYQGSAPIWKLDDYQKDMLREYVTLLSKESRKNILESNSEDQFHLPAGEE